MPVVAKAPTRAANEAASVSESPCKSRKHKGKLVRGAIGRKTELLQYKPSFMLIGKKRISLKKAFPVYFDNRS